MLQTTTKRITAGARRLPSICSSSFHIASPIRSDSDTHTSKDKDVEIEAVKARAWYLQPDAPESSTETPAAAAGSRQPRFTTFDPLRTMPTPLEEVVIPPLPSDTPTYLRPLHDFLTSNELFVPQTVTFRRTAKSAAARTFHDPSVYPTSGSSYLGKTSSSAYGHGRRRRGQTDSGEGIVVEGKDVGANWDWVVVCQVAARGKGAVGRAEKNLREWLFKNPLNRPPPPSTARTPKFKAAGDPDSEWSLLDVGDGVCINLMTAEGRQKWDLEGAWRPV
ncbi:hypothetical protein QFC21_002653 [Naganishia friedmannii]|uniref:Uncharacterized protein n=1 Tax=Naganishia friedmannii TaxID=89922 RepID=A0ACC2VWI7_9TREE|nr:hypothetical protein QFC21_002653 [Naganishia friedmannii]